MKTRFAFVVALLLGMPALAADAPDALIRPVGDAVLDQFAWVARPVIVFADSAADPRYIRQIELLEAEEQALRDRDVVVLTDTDPAARSAVRQALRPRGFALVLVGKDGKVALRKPTPWHVRELTRVIDKMPLRQQELREAREAE
ncbi:DUF4174 domain-containing protein [Pseudoprimorskyibacter insulae]|uniref:DUF4174 domain-containing protein n=1 Tax=Pseudoprimorskyibacter insulae TaxID=1695997 RepID=A0A2R8AQI4_9RHOB|nr:DUF4174 domain-containing protein [Pseudoprimorskyibacter insulae]SPF78331.1 hypothetical protein PRI8871_00927 [Pseudoprimorskyibacter insulae]